MIALLRAVVGLILWAVAFSTLYGLQGLACATGWDAVPLMGISAARIVLLLAYAGWLAILGWVCWRFYNQPVQRDMLSQLAFASALVGLVSTIFTGLPVLATTICV